MNKSAENSTLLLRRVLFVRRYRRRFLGFLDMGLPFDSMFNFYTCVRESYRGPHLKEDALLEAINEGVSFYYRRGFRCRCIAKAERIRAESRLVSAFRKAFGRDVQKWTTTYFEFLMLAKPSSFASDKGYDFRREVGDLFRRVDKRSAARPGATCLKMRPVVNSGI